MIILLYSLILVYSSIVSGENYSYKTKYIEVPVDHFSFINNETFKLRYLVNDTYYLKRGPVFFYTGNEADITVFAQNTGFVNEIAPQFNALIVFAEHRYYGTSLPFGNESYASPKYLGYLTSSQALADFVYIIDEIQKDYLEGVQDIDKLPVVAFGGSYGGMLSSWLRMKYPQSVIGAIASSAPIWYFKKLTPCGNFNKIVTDVYRGVGSNECPMFISKSWQIIRDLSKTSEGQTLVKNTFTLCNNITNTREVDKLIEWLGNVYVNIAMINYPYPTDFLAPIPGHPVREFCYGLIGYNISDNTSILNALANGLKIYTNYTGQTKCNNIDSSSDALGENGWNFQACTEMIMPMCSTPEDMFENSSWDFKKYSDECFANFGVRPPREDFPVLEYGAKDLSAASDIIFTNGLLDPWSSGGVLNNVSSKVYSIIMPDTAHHLDLRAGDPADPDSVVQARHFNVRMIKVWLDKFYNNHIH